MASPWLIPSIVLCLHAGHAKCVSVLLLLLRQHVEMLTGTCELIGDTDTVDSTAVML